MALSVSGFPESSSDSGKLINRIFGANRTADDCRPLPVLPAPYQPVGVDTSATNIRPLPQIPPSSTSSPSSSPTRQPIRSTLPSRNVSYKRPRTSSQGFRSGSTTPTTSTPIPISWASRPVDLNAQRPGVGSSAATAGYRSTSKVVSRRHIPSISTGAYTPISASTPTSISTPSGSAFVLTPTSTPPSFTSPPLSASPQIPHSLPRRSRSNTRLGIKRERSFDGCQNKMRMAPPSPVPLGLSFSRLASVSSPQSRTQAPTPVQSQSAVKMGSRERGDSVRLNDVGAAGNAANNRPALRPLPYKSPIIPDPEPHPSTKMLSPIITTKTPPITTATATSPANIGGVINKPTLISPRSIAKQKLQLSLQIPAIPMLGPDRQDRDSKPQLPVLKLVTDTILHPSSTTSSPSIKLSPSPSSPSPLSYVSYSLPHSPVSPNPGTTNAKQRLLTSSSSPVQSSPTHSSLFSGDSRIHLHPLSLSSPISGTTSGSASVRTSVGAWVVGGTGGGGGVSPGGRSVKSLSGRSINSLGGRRPRSVRSTRSTRSTRSMRGNRSRRSTNKIRTSISPLPSPDPATSIATPTPLYSTSAYTHLDILGDHVGEYIGDGGGGDGVGDGERDGFEYGYVEDGWGGGGSPSPIRYARPDSRGNLSSDAENGDGDYLVVGTNGTGDDSAASSEVEFADVDGDSDDLDEGFSERRSRRRRSRRWRVDRTRGGGSTRTTTDNTPSMTTSSPSLSLSLPQYTLAQALAFSHHSSHSSSHSNPSVSSPLSSSSSTNSYSNPYSTRKDRKRARKIQPRSFRHSYRMPPIVPLEEERGRGRGEENGGGQQGRRKSDRDRASSPVVMISMIPFRRKTPPPAGGGDEEQVALDSGSATTKKKSKDKEKEKVGKKGKPLPRATTAPSKRKPTKSAIDLFNSVSASMAATYAQSASSISAPAHPHPQSTFVPPLPAPPHSSYPQSQSGSGSTSNTRASSPERGRKSIASTTTKTRKKFAEAVSLALEEVTSRGRAGGVSQGPFQSPGKTNPITGYSSGSSHLGTTTVVATFDEMEVLDISRLPGGEDEEEVEEGVEKHMDVSVEVESEAGVGEQQHQQQQMEKGKKQKTTLKMTMKSGNGGVGVGTTSSALPESNPFLTVHTSDGGNATIPLPPRPSIPRRPLHQKQKQKPESWSSARRRGTSLGRPSGGSSSIISGSNRRYLHPSQHTQNPYNRNNTNTNTNTPFQLQPAYTTGISCGLPVSRPQPFVTRSVIVRPPLPPLPFSAPSGYATDEGGGSMVVSRPISPLFMSRSVRPAPAFSALSVSDSSKAGGLVMGMETRGT